jgi:hypothetical protein
MDRYLKIMISVLTIGIVTTCMTSSLQNAYQTKPYAEFHWTIDELVHMSFEDLEKVAVVYRAE